MKKRLIGIIPVLALLMLCACSSSGEAAKPFAPDTDPQALLSSGAFSEELTAIDTEIACARYGIDAGTVTAGAVYGSTGLTAEELAVFTFDTEEHAAGAAEAMGYWLADRTADMETYLPNEVPKLKDAAIETRGASLLLAVCSDYGPLDDFLKG